MDIGIVGGSLGGLMTGIAMLRTGHRVTIYESTMKDQGDGIVAGSQVQKFFDAYDVTKTLIGVKSIARQYLRKDGSVLGKDERPQSMTSWNKLYGALRRNFDGRTSKYVHDNEAPIPLGRYRTLQAGL